jgi:hypothetical protein
LERGFQLFTAAPGNKSNATQQQNTIDALAIQRLASELGESISEEEAQAMIEASVQMVGGGNSSSSRNNNNSNSNSASNCIDILQYRKLFSPPPPPSP